MISAFQFASTKPRALVCHQPTKKVSRAAEITSTGVVKTSAPSGKRRPVDYSQDAMLSRWPRDRMDGRNADDVEVRESVNSPVHPSSRRGHPTYCISKQRGEFSEVNRVAALCTRLICRGRSGRQPIHLDPATPQRATARRRLLAGQATRTQRHGLMLQLSRGTGHQVVFQLPDAAQGRRIKGTFALQSPVGRESARN